MFAEIKTYLLVTMLAIANIVTNNNIYKVRAYLLYNKLFFQNRTL